jgi:hypothetical protein
LHRKGYFNIGRLAAEVENVNSHLRVVVTELCTLLLRHIATLDEEIASFDRGWPAELRQFDPPPPREATNR